MPESDRDREFNEFTSPEVTAWKLARAVIEHENHLVNHRLTWFLSSQAFLFSAFLVVFVAWSKTGTDGKVEIESAYIPYMLLSIDIFATYICLLTYIGLERAIHATDRITHQYRQKFNGYNPYNIVPHLHYWPEHKKNWIYPIDQRFLPLVTILVWLVLAFICAVIDDTLCFGVTLFIFELLLGKTGHFIINQREILTYDRIFDPHIYK